ncbi:unnamed protein product, partial [Dibothriocephalus latus]
LLARVRAHNSQDFLLSRHSVVEVGQTASCRVSVEYGQALVLYAAQCIQPSTICDLIFNLGFISSCLNVDLSSGSGRASTRRYEQSFATATQEDGPFSCQFFEVHLNELTSVEDLKSSLYSLYGVVLANDLGEDGKFAVWFLSRLTSADDIAEALQRSGIRATPVLSATNNTEEPKLPAEMTYPLSSQFATENGNLPGASTQHFILSDLVPSSSLIETVESLPLNDTDRK